MSTAASGRTWAIVLAAGEGTRLSSLTRDAAGTAVPKQFCSLGGATSLLEQTLVRATTVVAHQRVTAIVASSHRRYWQPALTIGTQDGFPNSAIPALDEVVDAFGSRFVLEDWHNFGLDYDRTLAAWHRNFEAAWSRLAARYGERFRRLWHYYLAASAASFHAGRNHLWQLVLAPHGRSTVYRGVR
jgi:hypothetical protein